MPEPVGVGRWVAPLVGLLLLGGCGSEVSGSPAAPPPPQQVVDPCTVLTDAQLWELGVRPESRRVVSELDARGCGWLGDPFGFTLTTNPDTVADYRDRRDSPIFNSFRENEVTGHPGVQFSTISDQCAQVLTAGSGGLVANVSDSSGVSDPVDECAEALRIMTMIEPKLPEAGS